MIFRIGVIAVFVSLTACSISPTTKESPMRVTELTTELGTTVEAYVLGQKKAKAGVLLLHDRWGFNSVVLDWGKLLAAKGYRVLVLDLFDGRTPENETNADEITSQTDPVWVTTNINAGVMYLNETTKKVGIVGVGFGADQMIYAASQNPQKVAAIVDYYGNPESDEKELYHITADFLGVYPERSERVSIPQLTMLTNTLKAQGNHVQTQAVSADYGFANPANKSYNAEQANDSWQVTEQFLDTLLLK